MTDNLTRICPNMSNQKGIIINFLVGEGGGEGTGICLGGLLFFWGDVLFYLHFFNCMGKKTICISLLSQLLLFCGLLEETYEKNLATTDE